MQLSRLFCTITLQLEPRERTFSEVMGGGEGRGEIKRKSRYLRSGKEGKVGQESAVLLLESRLGELTRGLEDIS